MSISLDEPLTSEDWGLIVGPATLTESLPTVCVEEMSEYPAEDIARTILSFPGTSELHPANPGWNAWQAKWKHDGRTIEIDGLYVPDDVIWCDAMLKCDCRLGDYLALLAHVQESHPGIWAYDSINDCLHCRDSMLADLAKYAAPVQGDAKSFLVAYQRGNVRMLRAMLNTNPKLANAHFERGRTMLHFAAFSLTWLCRLLLEHGADPNARDDDGVTPLSGAMKSILPDTVALFIAHDAELNEVDKSGDSLLHLAIQHDQFEVLRLLFSAGANCGIQDAKGRTPLQFAHALRKTDAINLLS